MRLHDESVLKVMYLSLRPPGDNCGQPARAIRRRRDHASPPQRRFPCRPLIPFFLLSSHPYSTLVGDTPLLSVGQFYLERFPNSVVPTVTPSRRDSISELDLIASFHVLAIMRELCVACDKKSSGR